MVNLKFEGIEISGDNADQDLLFAKAIACILAHVYVGANTSADENMEILISFGNIAPKGTLRFSVFYGGDNPAFFFYNRTLEGPGYISKESMGSRITPSDFLKQLILLREQMWAT